MTDEPLPRVTETLSALEIIESIMAVEPETERVSPLTTTRALVVRETSLYAAKENDGTRMATANTPTNNFFLFMKQ